LESVGDFAEYLDSPDYEPPVDGITLVQEYLRSAEPFITRVEIVGGAFAYAITADTARGGFELCPADACAVDSDLRDGGADGAEAAAGDGLFALREGFDHPIVGHYLAFARRHGVEIAGFEFIETADGRAVTYDVNTNTNYNPLVEAAAPRSATGRVADYLKGLLNEAEAGADAVRVLDADLRRVAAQRARRGHEY
jgi:hypothetical protein